MNRTDWGVLLGLVLLATFVWLRDTTWMSSAEDTLPILVALPVFFYLGRPWYFDSTKPLQFPVVPALIFMALFLVGIAGDSTLLMAFGWVWLLWTWLKQRTPLVNHSSIKKLLVLPLMSFPWVTLDLQTLGWYFRLSGAFVTAHLYSLLGYEVQWEGTTIFIDKLPISVEAACAGLNTLQSMFIAGTVVAYVILGETNRYWPNLAVIFLMAWVANTSRIVLISAVALGFGREFAMGAFHTWGGWFILVLMFVLCWMIFELQAPKAPPAKSKT